MCPPVCHEYTYSLDSSQSNRCTVRFSDAGTALRWNQFAKAHKIAMQSANRARTTQSISGLPRVIETGGRNVVVSHTHLFPVGNLKICESTVSGVEVIKFRADLVR